MHTTAIGPWPPVNTTKSTITFGDGSDKEMCFTGMYKYPAGGGKFDCPRGTLFRRVGEYLPPRRNCR